MTFIDLHARYQNTGTCIYLLKRWFRNQASLAHSLVLWFCYFMFPFSSSFSCFVSFSSLSCFPFMMIISFYNQYYIGKTNMQLSYNHYASPVWAKQFAIYLQTSPIFFPHSSHYDFVFVPLTTFSSVISLSFPVFFFMYIYCNHYHHYFNLVTVIVENTLSSVGITNFCYTVMSTKKILFPFTIIICVISSYSTSSLSAFFGILSVFFIIHITTASFLTMC